MGVDLGDIFARSEISMSDLLGRVIAIDTYNTLYQFLSIIRQPDGTPLMDSQGRTTSHLSGLIYRTANLIEAGIKPVFVFDGEPPEFKSATLEERSKIREQAEKQWQKAKAAGSEDAFKYAQASARLNKEIVQNSQELIKRMGLPWVQAPSEGEAQAAFMVSQGDAHAVSSQDYDSLLFGANLLLRNLAVTGRRKLPGKNVYINVQPELIELERGLMELGISMEQLVDIALLVGTDFNPGIKGIGPKKALKLIQKNGSIEGALIELGEDIPNFSAIKEFFLDPRVTSEYEVGWSAPDEDAVLEFLCEEHDFSRERVEKALSKMAKSSAGDQKTLEQWF